MADREERSRTGGEHPAALEQLRDGGTCERKCKQRAERIRGPHENTLAGGRLKSQAVTRIKAFLLICPT